MVHRLALDPQRHSSQGFGSTSISTPVDGLREKRGSTTCFFYPAQFNSQGRDALRFLRQSVSVLFAEAVGTTPEMEERLDGAFMNELTTR